MKLTFRQQCAVDAKKRYMALQEAYLDILSGTAAQYVIDGCQYTALDIDKLEKAMNAALLDMQRALTGSGVRFGQVIQKYGRR